ncbi:MAG: glutamyl-tRNA reductase [Chloroflexi bacterium]|nr:glutamyl-tRNA reductase [Chloroflexota bacterium]
MMPHQQIVCLGLSHRTAPVDVREQLRCSLLDVGQMLPAFEADHLENDALTRLSDETVAASWQSRAEFTAVRELVILSTCNRLELYALLSGEVDDPRALLTAVLATVHQTDLSPFQNHLYHYVGETAVTHLLRVASGLDSLVLGEPQILGQVTSAYMAAVQARTIGPALDALFRAAMRAGKRTRAETTISSSPSSVSSVAIALAQEAVGDLNGRHTLVIGLGEMGRLALKALGHRGVTQVSVANRTWVRAETAVAPFHGRPYALEQLPDALLIADVVISATASPIPVITVGMVRQAMSQRGARPLVLIDLAVPRDIDPAIQTMPNVRLYDVDDLQSSLDESLAARQAAVPLVEMIVAEETAVLDKELQQLAVQPLIADLHQKAEAIRQRELERTLRHLGDVDPQTLEHLQHLTRSLVNKLLHEPTKQLRTQAGTETAVTYASAVRELFGLGAQGD